MMAKVPFLLQGVNPSTFESLSLDIREERHWWVISAAMPGVRREGQCVRAAGELDVCVCWGGTLGDAPVVVVGRIDCLASSTH